MDDRTVDLIFTGSLKLLPPVSSKIVRIFTSSTFTDTAMERNTLMAKCYPRIKDYCREKHGLEFQTMPATRDNSKNAFSRTISNSSISMSAKVYHPATNLMPPSPPQSPTGVAPPFGTSRSSSTNSFSRQNSQTSGKYS